ncbi:Hypothetical protein FKW44_019064 [Caligus rogercresseyi]|uniref:Uncharacterized protein n=1 Tax=Caligus rogercresseyi TaxID=217165 RepID=A0A7T8JXX2_CALRO|nr:Hypothetical protein FKW44_019064 [Caligus rogercresseyi]
MPTKSQYIFSTVQGILYSTRANGVPLLSSWIDCVARGSLEILDGVPLLYQ